MFFQHALSWALSAAPGASRSSSLNLKRLNIVKPPLTSPGQRMSQADFIPQRTPNLPIPCYPLPSPSSKFSALEISYRGPQWSFSPPSQPSTLVPAAHLWQGSADPELGRHARRGSAEPRELVPHPRVFFHILFLGKDKALLTGCIQLLAACADSC